MLGSIFWLVEELIQIYIYVLIAAAIFSTLAAFGVLDTRNRIVYQIGDFLYRLSEPALAPIRQFLPNLGGIDISPVIAIIVLEALEMFLTSLYVRIVMSGSGF
ncbi:MAG TPA: YggT family protein [Acetobacteraceae bacterium]|nr:YggT family protein [Acetobacteraceae bacterium]